MFAVKFYGNSGNFTLPSDYIVEHRWVEDNQDAPSGYEKVSAKEFEELMSLQQSKLDKHWKWLEEERLKQERDRDKKIKEEKEKIEKEEKQRIELEKIQKDLEIKKQQELKKMLDEADSSLEAGKLDEAILSIIKFLNKRHFNE